jgi:type III restriction enzyme
MKITLKAFQEDYVGDLQQQFGTVQGIVTRDQSVALLLNAPTGSGKTMMATAFIEELLRGSETLDRDPDYCFLWLTDQPELNKQTFDKIKATSDLPVESLAIVNGGFDLERLFPSHIYFLNTQKLGANSSFVRTGDKRSFTLWETITNTVNADPKHFVLIIDEAHRGTQGKDAIEAETIVQKFLKGSPGELPAIPLVLGISATPDRFVQLCSVTNRPLFKVEVDPERVRESGLLKELVDLYHLDEKQPGDVTMLVQAATDWLTYRKEWAAYGEAEHEPTATPVLVVQVEDSRTGTSVRSKTDLGMVVNTLAKTLGAEATEGWLAHAFQDDSGFDVGGHHVRYLAPSEIDQDDQVKAVLFKTSLNTGWDCPRAEVMVSFRTARDETAIAQLVGRMVRAPLGRRIDANEHLNTVALYLPFYDSDTVEKIVKRLTGDPRIMPPTKVREGTEAITLQRNADLSACFDVLQSLPSYTVPPSRPIKPVVRLGKLASLLAVTGLEKDPVKTYRARLVAVLQEERATLEGDSNFKQLMEEALLLDVRRRRIVWGVASDDPDLDTVLPPELAATATKATIADENIDDLFAEAGRRLGEGLHKEYLRTRMEGEEARRAKLEVYALVATPTVLDRLERDATEQRIVWTKAHKASFAGLDEQYRQAFRELQGAGAESVAETIEAPPNIEWTKAKKKWKRHLYVDAKGDFPEEFGASSWEGKVVETELKNDDVIGWFRNPSRKPWSLCLTRWEGTRYVPFYPDLLFFRTTGGGIIADLIDPHLLAAEDMPARAVRLAQFAQTHGHQLGRIEMVIYESAKDDVGKRIDLTDEKLRKRVSQLTTTQQLRSLFGDVSGS